MRRPKPHIVPINVEMERLNFSPSQIRKAADPKAAAMAYVKSFYRYALNDPIRAEVVPCRTLQMFVTGVMSGGRANNVRVD